MVKRSVQPNLFSFLPSKINKVKRSRVDENEEPDDSSSKSEPKFSAEALWSINLQSVPVPYQLSASSYANAQQY